MKKRSVVALASSFLVLTACSDSTDSQTEPSDPRVVEDGDSSEKESSAQSNEGASEDAMVDDLEACEIMIGDGSDDSVLVMTVDALSQVGPGASAVELGDVMQVQSIAKSVAQRTEGEIHDLVDPLNQRLTQAVDAISDGEAEELDMAEVRLEANDLVDYCLDAGYTVDPSIPRK